jgi:hypothetical protein
LEDELSSLQLLTLKSDLFDVLGTSSTVKLNRLHREARVAAAQATICPVTDKQKEFIEFV